MLKRLRQAFLWASVVTMLAVLLFVFVLLRVDMRSDLGSLKAILNTATAWTGEASSTLNDLAYKLADSSPSMRVTFLLPSGIVLADSGETLPDGEALVRSEAVQEAKAGAIGEAIDWRHPFSPTLYAAAMLGEGQMVLHLSYQDDEVRQLMQLMVPGLLLLTMAITLGAQLFLRPLTTRLGGQLEQISDLLQGVIERDQIDPNAFYPELRPSMVNICRMIDRMRYDLKEIEGAQRMQRDFVDNTSHELKSPLTSILGFAQMLQEEEGLSPQKQQEYVGYIVKDSHRMLAIIEDILLLERQQKPGADQTEDVQLRKVADEVARSLAPQCGQKGITIQVQGGMQVRAVEQDMWDLLRNLMANAVRYGKEQGRVEVRMQGMMLTVRDDGVGIAPEHLPHIFEKFYRADKAGSRNMGGTGLGLPIVAGIVNRYDASIHVDSTPGEGSCFTVDFGGAHAPQEGTA